MDTWVKKYSPSTIDDMVLEDSIKLTFNSYLSKENLPCITLAGRAGIGKTTCARILVNSISNCTSLYINASDENGIDMVRNKITDFVNIQPIGGGLKVVILDEADGLTSDGQKCLRSIMEKELDDTRFILTCNFIDKIIDPIKSRGPLISLKYTELDVCKRIFHILKEEGISNIKEQKLNIVNKVKKFFPDIRQTINVIEQLCISGKYIETDIVLTSQIDSTLDYIITNIKDLKKCREHWIKNEANFNSDYLELGKQLLNRFDDPNMLYYIGEKYYQLNIVLDKEIGFYMMVVQLYNLKHG